MVGTHKGIGSAFVVVLNQTSVDGNDASYFLYHPMKPIPGLSFYR